MACGKPGCGKRIARGNAARPETLPPSAIVAERRKKKETTITTLKERFLRYVSFPTTSDENSPACPSTPRQRDCARALADELAGLGMDKVKLDADGYVYARLPATPGRENSAPVGFIAHMDTAPDFSGENVKPQIIENYDGGDVRLPGSGAMLTVREFPHLRELRGRTLVTTDGTTLLGADDKAGIAEIMTALERIIAEKIPHAELWVAFTPDEEIGRGADRFSLRDFPARYAYTVDGDVEGGLEYENFNAAAAEITVKGKSVHPGSALGIMKNAGLLAAEFALALPPEETPARTSGRQGFFHLTEITGGVSGAKMHYLIREHDKRIFAARQEKLQALVREFNQKHGDGTFTLKITPSYANMREVLDKHPEVLERARVAIRAAGLEPVEKPVRGGTDGAALSFKGLPCPNLGTGGHAFHGPFEHITLEGMEKAVEIIINIARAEDAAAGRA